MLFLAQQERPMTYGCQVQRLQLIAHVTTEISDKSDRVTTFISKVANFHLLRQSQLGLRATYDSLRSDDPTL